MKKNKENLKGEIMEELNAQKRIYWIEKVEIWKNWAVKRKSLIVIILFGKLNFNHSYLLWPDVIRFLNANDTQKYRK